MFNLRSVFFQLITYRLLWCVQTLISNIIFTFFHFYRTQIDHLFDSIHSSRGQTALHRIKWIVKRFNFDSIVEEKKIFSLTRCKNFRWSDMRNESKREREKRLNATHEKRLFSHWKRTEKKWTKEITLAHLSLRSSGQSVSPSRSHFYQFQFNASIHLILSKSVMQKFLYHVHWRREAKTKEKVFNLIYFLSSSLWERTLSGKNLIEFGKTSAHSDPLLCRPIAVVYESNYLRADIFLTKCRLSAHKVNLFAKDMAETEREKKPRTHRWTRHKFLSSVCFVHHKYFSIYASSVDHIRY